MGLIFALAGALLIAVGVDYTGQAQGFTAVFTFALWFSFGSLVLWVGLTVFEANAERLDP